VVSPPDDNLLTVTLLEEVMHDAHRYAPGTEQKRPTIGSEAALKWRGLPRRAREHFRDTVERLAARGGFAHRHFTPQSAASALSRIIALGDGFEEIYALLDDESSRRALVDLLKLRVLGPYHTALQVTPGEFRERQARVNADLREQADTFEVSDPWFSPLSLYRVPTPIGPIRLHCHSVDIVSVFLLEQYSFARGTDSQVCAAPGDVVIDAGGCWGDTALYFASLVGDQGRVYTFEFDPESLEIMRANFALNPQLAKRIEVVEIALWDRSGETIGFTPAGRCTLTHVNGGSSKVATTTLDDFVAQAGLENLGFIKMDIEGAERPVLRGAQESIACFKPRLAIAAYHKDDDLIELPRAVNASAAEYRFHLGTFSAVEEETVLFAAPTSRRATG
jgi:FkbM family methyltransferase